ncbi:MAG: hypothetical protein U1F83_07000 [Verrucomicrobiota bacterium]
MTVANGQPFTVGDGILNPATLELQGGIIRLPMASAIISPNATVTGCGTVIGNVVNNGIYNNPCGAAALTVTISSLAKTGNVVTVFFHTQRPNHILEYKTNLTAPIWTPLAPGVIENGSVMSKTDASRRTPPASSIKVQ